MAKVKIQIICTNCYSQKVKKLERKGCYCCKDCNWNFHVKEVLKDYDNLLEKSQIRSQVRKQWKEEDEVTRRTRGAYNLKHLTFRKEK